MEIKETANPSVIRLDEMQPQSSGIVSRVETGREEVQRLKALGICVGRRIEVIKTGDPQIIRVFGSRIGLSAALAACVWIEPNKPEPRRKLTASKPAQQSRANIPQRTASRLFQKLLNFQT